MSATNVIAALLREGTYGTPATPVGSADRLRIIDSPGLKATRATIQSGERRSDQLENVGRLGSRTVGGSYNTEINPGGEFDNLIEDMARGTWGALAEDTDISPGGVGVGTQVRAVATPATPVYRSYTIDQYDVVQDQSEQFTGCRLVGLDISMQPDEMATCQWTFQAQNRTVLASGASPYFTAPAVTAGVPLVADDAVITYQGAPIATVTGMNISFAVNAAPQNVIGALTTPDIYMNDMSISGDLSAVRNNLDAIDDMEAETEFVIRVVFTSPGAGPDLIFAFELPRVKIFDVDAQFSGGDAAKVETRQFRAYAPGGANNAVEFYSSTETPVFV